MRSTEFTPKLENYNEMTNMKLIQDGDHEEEQEIKETETSDEENLEITAREQTKSQSNEREIFPDEESLQDEQVNDLQENSTRMQREGKTPKWLNGRHRFLQ